MLNDFDTDDFLSSRRDDVTPEDERTVSDLMVDQIEFADVIVLSKLDMVRTSPSIHTADNDSLMLICRGPFPLFFQVDEETKGRVRSVLRKLNRRAKVLESLYGKVDVKEIVNTGLFNLERAQTGYGWLQDLHEMTLREVSPFLGPWKKGNLSFFIISPFVLTDVLKGQWPSGCHAKARDGRVQCAELHIHTPPAVSSPAAFRPPT